MTKKKIGKGNNKSDNFFICNHNVQQVQITKGLIWHSCIKNPRNLHFPVFIFDEIKHVSLAKITLSYFLQNAHFR